MTAIVSDNRLLMKSKLLLFIELKKIMVFSSFYFKECKSVYIVHKIKSNYPFLTDYKNKRRRKNYQKLMYQTKFKITFKRDYQKKKK